MSTNSNANKTKYDWIQLIAQIIGAIAIPISIIVGLWQFNNQQMHEQQRMTDAQQQSTLQNYLDHISDLLLKNNLRESKAGELIRKIAVVQTKTALNNLNSDRKGILIQFLYESDLITDQAANHQPIINLNDANLDRANLKGTDLSNVDLSGANLNDANLSDANLSDANLSNTFLSRADLTKANLDSANLTQAILNSADLTQAILNKTNVTRRQMEETKH
jgi:uncharacterized protein YjbI with pentapeptide repeats